VNNVDDILWMIVMTLSVVHPVNVNTKGKMKLKNVLGAVLNVNLMNYTKVYVNIARRRIANEYIH
jgi:uncharacterized membrane-anchored protein